MARAARRSRSRASSGASVATTIMQEPSASARGPCPIAVAARTVAGLSSLATPARRQSSGRRRSSSAPARRPSTCRSAAARAATRADAAFPPERDRARARADRAFVDGPSRAARSPPVTCSRVTCRPRMSFRPPSLVSPTSALTDRTFSLPGCASVQLTTASTARRRQRVGEDDWRFDRAELLHLGRTGELAEGVADEHGARHLLAKQVAAVWDDRGDARADGVAVDERRVPDPHAGHVGDGVERPRAPESWRDPGSRAPVDVLGRLSLQLRETDQRKDDDSAIRHARRASSPFDLSHNKSAFQLQSTGSRSPSHKCSVRL